MIRVIVLWVSFAGALGLSEHRAFRPGVAPGAEAPGLHGGAESERLINQAQQTPEQTEKMLEPLRPAAPHKELAALAGRWTQDVTYSLGGPPMKTTGTVVNRMILGGRFLVSEGTSPNPSGIGDPTIEFMSIYGFDRRTNEYTIVAFDTMGTYYVTAAGRKTTQGTVLMSGETLEEHNGVKDTKKYDMTLRVVDADTYVSEIVFKFPGKPDLTVVSISHRRVK